MIGVARPDIGQWRSNPSAAFFTLLAKSPIMLRIDSRFFACRLRNKRTPRAACSTRTTGLSGDQRSFIQPRIIMVRLSEQG